MPPDAPAAVPAAPAPLTSSGPAASTEAAVSVPAASETASAPAALAADTGAPTSEPAASTAPDGGAAAPAEPSPVPEPGTVPDGKPSMLGGEAEKPKPQEGEPQPDPSTAAQETQEQGQKLIDLYADEVRHFHEQMAAEQHRVFGETRAAWRKAVTEDREIGGNRLNTTLAAVRALRDRFATDDAHLKEFARVLDFTGAGDHPAVIRWFANAAKGLAQLHREPGPVPASQPAPARNRYERRYSTTQGS